jgi:hypothetical protein
MIKIKPIYRAGAFMGFSTRVKGEWTPPQSYKLLMLAVQEVNS